jgi:hypothetical protein
MKDTLLIILSAIIAIIISLALPSIEPLLKACKVPFICGVDLKNVLKFLGKTDSAAIDFGYHLYQKIVKGMIIFIITLTVSSVFYRRYLSSKK